jgi:hypothetical protein
MERNILGGFLFRRINCAVTFVPLNKASQHTIFIAQPTSGLPTLPTNMRQGWKCKKIFGASVQSVFGEIDTMISILLNEPFTIMYSQHFILFVAYKWAQ